MFLKICMAIFALILHSSVPCSAENPRIALYPNGDVVVLNGQGERVLSGDWHYNGWDCRRHTVGDEKRQVSGEGIYYEFRGVWGEGMTDRIPLKYVCKTFLRDGGASLDFSWELEAADTGKSGIFLPFGALSFTRYDNAQVFVWTGGQRRELILKSEDKTYKQMGPSFDRTEFVLSTGEKVTLEVRGMNARWQRADGSNFRIMMDITRSWTAGQKTGCGFRLAIRPGGSEQ